VSVDGSSVLVWPLVLGASLAWFLLPGLLGAAALSRRGVVPETAVALTAVALSSALGYAVFWAYLAGPGAGRVASLAGTAAAAVALSRPGARRLLARTVRSPAVAVPLGLLFVVALFYNAILFAHASSTPVELRARTHLMRNDGLPIDNDLPRLLAARLAEGRDPRPIYPEWQSSDRPPLQTGAVLLQRPFASALGIEALHYQLLATALQCSWVAAVWALGAAFRFRPAGTALALAAATFSGFFFVNSLYVWPKLYAGALALLALVLLVGRRPSPATAAVAALGAALGLLAHAGVVFTLVPVAAFVVARRTRPPLVPALAGAAVVVVLMAPWWAYTRFYDPPGDRLTKRHLAGVLQADGRPLSAALADAYSRSEPSELVRNKWENLDALVEAPPGWRELRQGGRVLRPELGPGAAQPGVAAVGRRVGPPPPDVGPSPLAGRRRRPGGGCRRRVVLGAGHVRAGHHPGPPRVLRHDDPAVGGPGRRDGVVVRPGGRRSGRRPRRLVRGGVGRRHAGVGPARRRGRRRPGGRGGGRRPRRAVAGGDRPASRRRARRRGGRRPAGAGGAAAGRRGGRRGGGLTPRRTIRR
jgi:hypothetical protein